MVTEKSCALCKPTLLDNLPLLHPGANIQVLDAASKEGRELIALHGAKTLPLYVLDAKVENDASFARLLPVAYYKSQGGYLIRHGPTNFSPAVQLDRKRRPRHLDLFVESFDGPSVQAEGDFVKFLLDNEKNIKDLTFSVHFVTQESIAAKGAAPSAPAGAVRSASLAELGGAPGSPLSPRGELEIQEDLRQLCLFQRSPIGTFLTYLGCRNRNLNDSQGWKACLPPEADIKACVEGKEGLDLLRQDARLARELDITRAPVFLWENRYGPFGFNEVDWRSLLLGREVKGDAP